MYMDTGLVSSDWDMSGMTWEYLDLLRETTLMKIVIKEVVTAEDAVSCEQHGADAVSVGRAYIWTLAAFGQPGVEKLLQMLNAELSMVVEQVGAQTISDIGAQHIGR